MIVLVTVLRSSVIAAGGPTTSIYDIIWNYHHMDENQLEYIRTSHGTVTVTTVTVTYQFILVQT
jgi:hypothetical protein